MEKFQEDLSKLLFEADAFKMGSFQLKSGGISPYFVNFGAIATGQGLRKLGTIYASCLVDCLGADGFNVLVGPAYKGIPLATATATALASEHNIDVKVVYNRKEAKGHGSDAGTVWVGGPLKEDDKAVILDDVFTSGGTKADAMTSLAATWPQTSVIGMLVGVDRLQHSSQGGESMEAFCQQHNLRKMAVLNICELTEHLQKQGHLSADEMAQVMKYVEEGA
jgi:orotate phosphoribosyltransferase